MRDKQRFIFPATEDVQIACFQVDVDGYRARQCGIEWREALHDLLARQHGIGRLLAAVANFEVRKVEKIGQGCFLRRKKRKLT